MYAHVNVWRLTDEGAAWKHEAASVIGAALGTQPGFRWCTLVRSGEWELVVITAFATQAELEAAIAALTPLVREMVEPLTEGVIERRQGPVVFHLAAPAVADRRAA